MHVCVTCHEPGDATNSIPCTFCEGWFHLARNGTRAGGRRCGRRALNFMHEGFCGAVYICRACDARLAEHAATGRSWTV